MNNIQTLKLVTDGLLVLSLLYLCYRFARSAKPSLYPQGTALEVELRSLLKDADQAARALNDKLLKRQTKLEELLFELEGLEGRVNRAVGTFEDSKNDLEIQTQKAQKISQALAAELSRLPRRSKPVEPRAAATADFVEPEPIQASAPAVEPRRSAASEIIETTLPVEPPSFETAGAKSPSPVSREKRAESRWSSVNIYGEPVGAAAAAVQAPVRKAAAPAPMRKSLASAVEKEVHASYAAGNNDHGEIQRIYDAAEDLLRAGEDLQTVASITSLPIEEIRMLSQMLAQEQITAGTAGTPESDARLGVLGATRRQVQVL